MRDDDEVLFHWWFALSETRKAAAEFDASKPSSWRCSFHRVSYDEVLEAARALGLPWTKEREREWRRVLAATPRDLKKGCYMCSQPFEEFREWQGNPDGSSPF